MNVNKAIVVGRLTDSITLKQTNTGKMVASFSVATNQNWTNDQGVKVEKTDFHNMVAWGKLAENLAQYCVKGQEMFFEGRMETRSWEDEETQKKMYRTEIVVNAFQFGAKPKGAESAKPENQAASEAPSEEDDNRGREFNEPSDEIDPEDIPF